MPFPFRLWTSPLHGMRSDDMIVISPAFRWLSFHSFINIFPKKFAVEVELYPFLSGVSINNSAYLTARTCRVSTPRTHPFTRGSLLAVKRGEVAVHMVSSGRRLLSKQGRFGEVWTKVLYCWWFILRGGFLRKSFDVFILFRWRFEYEYVQVSLSTSTSRVVLADLYWYSGFQKGVDTQIRNSKE